MDGCAMRNARRHPGLYEATPYLTFCRALCGRWEVVAAFLNQHGAASDRTAKEVLGKAKSLQKLDEDEVMNTSEQQENPVFRGPEEDCDGPSTTPNANDECVTPKKARTDNQEDYSSATIIDSVEMNCDIEAEDRPFTTVTYKKARPAGIPVIFQADRP
ncbi:hypothetical protein HPB51_020598 [Rhipicephalus microplus]|uniref:Uncharacterized protein n=1 Tax=Rhipicephalus microplus TaxID=6941 RepID=A0A9J6DID7_RHIMP|nr:hypothetical protein HPB51_020598 [Rhipicephalus microplus]